jgi:hypothetical protein
MANLQQEIRGKMAQAHDEVRHNPVPHGFYRSKQDGSLKEYDPTPAPITHVPSAVAQKDAQYGFYRSKTDGSIKAYTAPQIKKIAPVIAHLQAAQATEQANGLQPNSLVHAVVHALPPAQHHAIQAALTSPAAAKVAGMTPALNQSLNTYYNAPMSVANQNVPAPTLDQKMSALGQQMNQPLNVQNLLHPQIAVSNPIQPQPAPQPVNWQGVGNNFVAGVQNVGGMVRNAVSAANQSLKAIPKQQPKKNNVDWNQVGKNINSKLGQ